MCWQKDLAVSCPPRRAVASTGSDRPWLFPFPRGLRIHRFPPQTTHRPPRSVIAKPSTESGSALRQLPFGHLPPAPGEHHPGYGGQPQTLW